MIYCERIFSIYLSTDNVAELINMANSWVGSILPIMHLLKLFAYIMPTYGVIPMGFWIKCCVGNIVHMSAEIEWQKLRHLTHILARRTTKNINRPFHKFRNLPQPAIPICSPNLQKDWGPIPQSPRQHLRKPKMPWIVVLHAVPALAIPNF